MLRRTSGRHMMQQPRMRPNFPATPQQSLRRLLAAGLPHGWWSNITIRKTFAHPEAIQHPIALTPGPIFIWPHKSLDQFQLTLERDLLQRPNTRLMASHCAERLEQGVLRGGEHNARIG